MYEEFFHLTANPFLLTPDPRFFAPTQCYREAFAGLLYALHWRKGFVALSAEPGTGKTMLLSVILRSLSSQQACSSYLINPTLTASEFLEAIMLDFGISNIPQSKAQRLKILRDFLLQAHAEGRTAILLIDEAHKLSPELLEEVRLLTNFENAETKLLQVVLAGQPELDEVLNREDLRQLRQRISMRLTLQALSAPETSYYVRHRWTQTGTNEPLPFSPEAIAAIFRTSKGIPRVVNVLCDNCLTLAFSQGVRSITAQHVVEAASDLQMNCFHLPAQQPPSASLPCAPPVQVPAPDLIPFDSIRTLNRQEELPKSSLLIRIALLLGCKIKHPVPKLGPSL